MISKTTNAMDFETVALNDAADAIVIIDQTQLPGRKAILSLTEQKDIRDAIYLLKVRGAPAIGITAAFAVYLAAKQTRTESWETFHDEFKKASSYIASSRPTAVNLCWALDRMERMILSNKDLPVPAIKGLLRDEALAIKAEDTEACRKIGEHGLTLLKPGAGIITHCNAGYLATSKYGTATAPIYLGHERGYSFRVFCDETRPLLQGARLTAYELVSAGVDTTLICDSMSAAVMAQGLTDAVFVGCDRVAANGDTANKIGTLNLAINAKHYGIPFYVCAPTSTIDMKCDSGRDIHIENRPPEEVTDMWYEKPMAPSGVKVFNPAFDVTDGELITAIITERGVIYPPYGGAIRQLMEKQF
jgi:methylthioribose-1-phosphate isomerase